MVRWCWQRLTLALICFHLMPTFAVGIGDYLSESLLFFAHKLSTNKVVKKAKTINRRPFARLHFSNCGDKRDPVLVDEFQVAPNPVSVPGNVEVHLKMDVRKNQTSPLPVSLEMMKKVPLLFGLSTWFRVPCLSNGIGSCDYEDLCITQLFHENKCMDPKTKQEKACGCPFRTGVYTLKPAIFQIPEPPNDVPGYLLEGEFYVKATVKRNDEQIACYSTNVDLLL
ncbi:ganglioside GM2 activator-like [Centruroides vittatus]|uniref:ganglioside GM2 activator-like n=1 Tax=Centruroides vittatus TaxID=120091 RepID=UPI003510B212